MLSVSIPSGSPPPAKHPLLAPLLCFSLSFILDYNHHLLQVAENVFVWPKEMEIKGLDVTAWGLEQACGQ